MPLQVLVGEFVGYSALFLRTIEGKPTCIQYHQCESIRIHDSNEEVSPKRKIKLCDWLRKC